MATPDPTPYEQWAGGLDATAKKLAAIAKAAVAAQDDPFSQREQLERAADFLDGIDVPALKGQEALRRKIETQCVEGHAEFWQRFLEEAKAAAWEVHGSTDRRLVARAYFVELKNGAVTIDGVTGRHSPHVPGVVQALAPLVKDLNTDKAGLQQFCNVLCEAFDILGGRGEVPIEAAFRQCVILSQPSTFWTNIDTSKFRPLTRPVFRSRLTALLADSLRSTDGRELRLFPTVNRKDVWELFSPAEGRVVQVGRLAFPRK